MTLEFKCTLAALSSFRGLTDRATFQVMTDNIPHRLYRLAGTLRTLRDSAHHWDPDLSEAIDLSAQEAEAILRELESTATQSTQSEHTVVYSGGFGQ